MNLSSRRQGSRIPQADGSESRHTRMGTAALASWGVHRGLKVSQVLQYTSGAAETDDNIRGTV